MLPIRVQCLAVSSALLLLLALPHGAAAQAGPPPGMRGGDGPPAPPSVDERVQHLTERLKLDGKQATSIRAILVKADSTMARGRAADDAARMAMRAQRAATDSAIGAVLNAEQREQFAKIRQERRGPGGRGGPGGGDGPPHGDRDGTPPRP